MGRRRQTAPWEDFVAIIARMPWWLALVLAVASYVWLHGVATRPMVIDPAMKSLPMAGIVWRGVATAGQYVLPLLFVASAVVSVFRRRQRNQLVDNVTQSDSSDALHDMSWREFEVLVSEGFRLQGYTVEETGGGGPDGGIDLVLSRPGRNGREKYLVQCKQWRAYKVGVDVVRELYGVMAARGAAGGFVVTSGRFTEEATAFASGRNVRLVDGEQLHGLIREARANLASRRAQAARVEPVLAQESTGSSTPQCPTCGKAMVRRTAKRGATAGREFWGCEGYPACRGTRPMQ